MAAAHGHDPHHDDDHGHAKGHAHAHPEPAEDALVTPGWMPFVGFGLLVAAALGIYLFLSPGVLATPTSTGDGGAETADASAAPAH